MRDSVICKCGCRFGSLREMQRHNKNPHFGRVCRYCGKGYWYTDVVKRANKWIIEYCSEECHDNAKDKKSTLDKFMMKKRGNT